MKAAGLFLIIAIIAFLTHIVSVKTNPADSGLSAIWFYLCTIPWVEMLPKSLFYSKIWKTLNYPVGWCFVLLNTFLIYCLFGGIKFKK